MGRVIVKYNVTSTTSRTYICNKTTNISDILYNGESIGVAYRYTFPEVGEQTLEFIMKNNSIGFETFRNTTTILEVSFKEDITDTGMYSFFGCTNLRSIDFGNDVKDISLMSFRECTSLTALTIPNNVINIGSNAFYGCSNLEYVTFGSGVKTMGIAAFGNTGLKEVIIPDNVEVISNHAFSNSNALTKVIIGNGISYIPKNAFDNCPLLTEVSFGTNVTRFEIYAFRDCTSINKLTFLNENGIGSIKNTISVIFPEGLNADVYYSGIWDLVDCGFKNDLISYGWNLHPTQLNRTIESGGGLFVTYNYTDSTATFHILKSLDWVEDILYNGVSILSDLSLSAWGLYAVDYPIGVYTFEYILKDKEVFNIGNLFYLLCEWATKIVIPDSVKYLNGGGSIYDATVEIELGNGVEYLGQYCLDKNGLTISSELPNSLKYIGDYAFETKTNLTSITIPNGVKYIGDKAFYGCTGLTSITIPDSVTYFGTEIFYGCTELETAILPSTIKSIPNGIFNYCEKLNNITIPSNVINIEEYAFNRCLSLDTMQWEKEGIININGNAFTDTNFTKLTLPNSVKIIGTTAFASCDNLEEIEIGDNIEVVNTYIFSNSQKLKTIKVTAPYLPYPWANTTFANMASGGTLYYAKGANRNDWLNSLNSWNGVEMEVEEPEPEPIPDGEIVTPNQTKTIVTSGETFQYTIETTNINYLTSYYISFGGDRYLDTIDGFISIEMVNMNNFNITVEENEGNGRRCGIYFQYMDYNGNQLTHVLTIRQDAKPEEPTYIEPEIRLYKTRLDYASDGGDKYVQIDYYGATSILEPTCTQSWVTIQKTQGGWYEEEGVRVDQHQYKITMQPSSFARNTNVTFSCTDVNGKVFKDRYLMLYQSAAPAEPSVVVSKNQVNLDNVGEEDTIQVTYVNVNEITPPEVADGFTIEEISREELSGGRIQVTYKITRTSPKRQNTQINFSGTGSNGSTATSGNVTIKGEAVPAEFLVKIWPYEGDVLIVGEPNNDCLLDLYVYGYTGQYNFSYKINGDSSAIFVKNEEVWDSEDENAHVYFTLVLDAFPNNTNKSFIGTIDLTYTDEINNYSTSVPFKVRHANEGRIEAGSIKYEYDKDGNSTYTLNGGDFHIFYTNIETINEPAIDGDWIGVGEKVGNADRTDYHYAITIQPNSGAARKGYVTFSGKGIDGKDYSLEIEVKQEGTDTVKPVDIGFIELQQLSVELMADGEPQTFKVKYYDVVEILEPELEFDWATITEVNRTEPVPDVAWNGEECESLIITYRVTAEPTDSGRQMKVLFKSIINYYDNTTIDMFNNKFIIYQLAEGSTEVQGDIALLRYSKAYTYYGSPKGFNPEVGYTDLAPSTPIFSETWCRVKSYTDTTARDYDFIRRYELEMDKNESNLSRRCTITFVGEAQDGTKATVEITVTQEGQEEIINEGEYSNYKGYFRDFEGALHSIAFITNPRSDVFGDIRLAGDSPVVVSYSTNSELYEPLRTSTCTVKVLTSNYLMNLYTGKAKGTQVILKNEDTGKIEWCGFLQPNLYNQGFTECIEEVEFEASDCLQTLQYLKYEYLYQGNGQPMIVNYKEIIDYILDECELISAYNITQKMFTDSKTNRIIDFKNFYMSENNFYSEEGEPWTLQEVMEETCKFFGFVCFQWGDEIYFMDFDKFQSNKQMYGLKYTKDSWSWQGPVDIYISDKPNEVTERSYRGSGADVSLDDIFNKVTVNCNYYNIDELIPDLFEDDFLEERNTISITSLVNHASEIGRKTDFIVYDHKNINSIFYKPIVATNSHQIQATPTEEDFKKKDFFKTYVGGNIVDMVSLNYSELNRDKAGEPKDWERYLMISQLNRPWCAGFAVGGTSQAWETYNFPIMEFHNLPQIFIDNTEEAFEDNSSSSTGGRVPSTGGRVPSTRVGFGSSSPISRNDRETSTVRVNKGKHYLVIDAEAAFVDRFDMPYIPDEAAGFGKKSNYDFNGYTYDQIRGNGNKTNVTPTLTFYLEIPQAGWWDGKKWVDNETWFEVPLEEADYLNDLFYSFKGAQNTVATNLFLGKTGYKIELPQTMESTAFMQFKIGMPKRFAHILNSEGGDNTGQAGNAYCFIKDLKMNIVSKNTSLMENEDMVYENIIDDNNVVDGPEIDLKITSDNYICYSLSTVSTKYEADNKPTTNFRFFDMENNPVKPEECIIERYVNQYSTPSLKENLTLDMSFLPTQLITDTYWGDGKNFVIVAQELDYARCSQKVTLLEKK